MFKGNEMFNISNVKVNDNAITCNVDNDEYSLEFDNGDTLCVLLVNNVETEDYDEDLINEIICMSFEVEA